MSLALLTATGVSKDDEKWVAVPRDRHDAAETDETDKAIRAKLGDDNVYSYVSPYQGLAFWFAPMTPDQREQIKNLPGVSSLRP